MDVECTYKPFKHCMLSKERNRLSDENGIVMFRAGQNLKHLHHAWESIKGKVNTGDLGMDSTHDVDVNTAAVSQAEVYNEFLD